jgi:inward rectifier potassium channel
MALLENNKPKGKADKNTGFGTNASSYGGVRQSKNGSAVEKRGMPILQRISWYQYK